MSAERQSCVSYFCSYLLWYWLPECETKTNDGRTASPEEGKRRGKTEAARLWKNISDSSGWAEVLTASLSFFLRDPASVSKKISKYHYCSIQLLITSREDFIWGPVHTKPLLNWLGVYLQYTPDPHLAARPEEQNESRAAGQHSGFLRPDGRCERSQLGVPTLRPWSRVIYTRAKASKRQGRRKLNIHCVLKCVQYVFSHRHPSYLLCRFQFLLIKLLFQNKVIQELILCSVCELYYRSLVTLSSVAGVCFSVCA